MSRPTAQTARLLRYLDEHPGCTSLDITINLRIVNVTGRISDLRAQGHVIECRRERTVDRYYLVREGMKPDCMTADEFARWTEINELAIARRVAIPCVDCTMAFFVSNIRAGTCNGFPRAHRYSVTSRSQRRRRRIAEGLA